MHRGYWNSVDTGFMQWNCERRLYSSGLEVKCGITNLQRERDPMECGSYRGIKLLEHAMKVMERIFKNRIWQQIDIDDMQFGFVKGNLTKCDEIVE